MCEYGRLVINKGFLVGLLFDVLILHMYCRGHLHMVVMEVVLAFVVNACIFLCTYSRTFELCPRVFVKSSQHFIVVLSYELILASLLVIFRTG